MGRIPEFVWNDRGADLGSLPRDTAAQREHSRAALNADAKLYKSNFSRALQYFQMRCQHHMHPLRRVKRKVLDTRDSSKRRIGDEGQLVRIIPNACQSKVKSKSCTHGAPWATRINTGGGAEPVLVCPGIAKRRNLRRSGTRNTVGTMLLRRNNEWLNCIIPGFCIAFAGSDEYHICKRNCVGKRCLFAKMSRRMTLLQSTRDGYYGGYMSNRQKVGHFESKKCIDNMYSLRARTAGLSEAKRRRAVSGRMNPK